MNPSMSLNLAAKFLDEATENLTFGEYLWAFEEVWHGIAWALNSLLPEPSLALELGHKGALPRAGSLSTILATLKDAPKEARIVQRIETLRPKPDVGFDPTSVERLVFDAWDLHDACGRRLHIPDDRLAGRLVLADVSPGRVGSQTLHRRTALKILAVGTLMPLQACSKVEQDNRHLTTPQPSPAVAQQAMTAAKIKAVSPLPGMQWPTTDPFLFCAHHQDHYPAGNENMGPMAPLTGRQLGRDFDRDEPWRMYHGRRVPGFPSHPHRGFETVTVVRTGRLDHSDSLGATARYGDGDVQWLTAGRGIQHAEMFPLLKTDSPNPLELFQIWMNLPRTDKMVDPYFTMLWSEKIPRVTEADSNGRVTELTLCAGAYKGSTPQSPPPNSWASRKDSNTAIWNLRMEPKAAFTLPSVPKGTWRSLYVHRGAGIRIADTDIPHYHRVEFEESGTIELISGAEETEILLLQARPIGEPVAKRGPFVMNTQQEIRQAFADYQMTEFGGWPWISNDPVHDRAKGRFAIHADGNIDEPT